MSDAVRRMEGRAGTEGHFRHTSSHSTRSGMKGGGKEKGRRLTCGQLSLLVARKQCRYYVRCNHYYEDINHGKLWRRDKRKGAK